MGWSEWSPFCSNFDIVFSYLKVIMLLLFLFAQEGIKANPVEDDEADDDGACDDMEGLLNDVFGDGANAGQNEEAEKFHGLIERASQ
ncbi:hypothetical protein PIB30_079283 [Stylosanthes scabra]|uniref:Uncharacterized protein n=1 Tax=Stylosanthes scabra TaxID=79078 RepID=A0ABU6WRW5_9FABA|nr:hypothetical protein [Stylosanthes scabra]